jgi:hypothetical protein
MGHDADSCRANLGADGRVSCFTCGQVNLVLPESTRHFPLSVRRLLTKLGGTTDPKSKVFRVIHVNNQADEMGKSPDFSYRAFAAAAQDIDASAFDVNRVVLAADEYNLETITFTFTPDDVEASERVPTGARIADGDCELSLRQRGLPEHCCRAVATMIEEGFRVVNIHQGVALRISLVKGAREGIHAEVTFHN